MMRDLHTVYFNLLNLELCEGMFENVRHGLETQADAIGEQQLKRMQSGSSS